MEEIKLFRMARKVKEVPKDYVCSYKGDCYACLYRLYKIKGDIYVKLFADDDKRQNLKREGLVSADFVIPEIGKWCSAIRKERLIPVDNDEERRRFILNRL
jgi:hypothetical protein